MSGTGPSRPPRAWQRMLSGRRLDLLAPDPADIAIEDIAHGLARLARWNGQTRGAYPFSVAQHTLIVEEITADLVPDWPVRWRLAALLHDAPEYVIGDLISPFKTAIGLDYKTFERRLLAAIHHRFGLPGELPWNVANVIKAADGVAAYFEATVLAGFEVDEALSFFGRPDISPELAARLARIEPRPAEDVQRDFLARFEALQRAISAR